LKQVITQISRTPKKFPSLNILKPFNGTTVQDQLDYLETLSYDDFVLENYNPDKLIKAKMIA
jgi:thymidylate synthase